MANQNLFQNYLTRPKSVDEYGQASANRELTEQRVLGARDANALQSLTMQQTRETMADATKKRNALRDIIQGLGPDAPPEKVIQALKSNPYTIDAGVALEKHIADVANTTATASNTTATAAKTNEAVRMEKIANHARGLELVKTPQDVVAFFQDGINTGALQGSVNEHLKQADQFDTLDAWKTAYRKAVVSEETKFKEGADTTRAAATSAASTVNANIAAASRLAPAGLQLDASGKAVVNPELMAAATGLRERTAAPKMRTRIDGETSIQEEFDPKTKTWNEIGRGPRAAGQGTIGARESVFINRILLSGNEAASDLENVVTLPMSASTGFFGGRKQGPTLFAAGREVLANKMTGQEAQSYNAMATGFQRSLAAIEAAGLMPTGSLTHQMDAVMWKEGDTNLTKLQKLAQTAQIVEAGLETTVSNPRIPKQTKDEAERIMKKIRQAVPFTHRDLNKMIAGQQSNPNLTLADVMKAKKDSDSPASNLPSQSEIDAELERRKKK